MQPFKPEAFADGLFDKIDYKEEEDIQLEINEESVEECEDLDEDILQEEELPNEDGGEPEEIAETTDGGFEQEEEITEEKTEKKEKRGFFGLFNRHS